MRRALWILVLVIGCAGPLVLTGRGELSSYTAAAPDTTTTVAQVATSVDPATTQASTSWTIEVKGDTIEFTFAHAYMEGVREISYAKYSVDGDTFTLGSGSTKTAWIRVVD